MGLPFICYLIFFAAINFEKWYSIFSGNISERDPDFSEYKPIYEDKDGDWMLVGDVPWE